MLKVIGGAQEGEFKAVASGTLPNGKAVIVNSDGTVSIITGATGSTGTNTEIAGQAVYDSAAVYDTTNDKVVVMYRRDSGGVGYYKVGTVTGTTVTFGAEGTFNGGGTAEFISACYDSTNDRVVVVFEASGGVTSSRVGAVSGTTVTWGSAVTVAASAGSPSISYDEGQDAVVVAYQRDSDLYGMVVVGETITSGGGYINWGTPVVINSADTFSDKSNQTIVYDSNAQKTVVAYRDKGNSQLATARVCTVNGTTLTVSLGAEATATNGAKEVSLAFDSVNNKVVLTSVDNVTDLGYVAIGTVSGTSISFGTPVDYSGPSGSTGVSKPRICFDSNAGKILITYRQQSGAQSYFYRTGEVSGTSVTIDTAVEIDSGANSGTAFPVYDPDQNTILINFSNTAVSDEFYSLPLQLSFTNLTAENYIGISSGGAVADTGSATVDIIGAVADVPATPYVIAGASYDSVSLDVTSQDTQPRGLTFKSDGTSFYVAGFANETIYQYDLTTAWDLSTASYASKSFSVATQGLNPHCVQFKSDGTKMYVATQQTASAIFQYSLSTAWDVSTASYDSVSFDPTTQLPGAQITSLFFKSDGTAMYAGGSTADAIYQYTLSTAWDLSTASYASKSLDVASEDSNPRGIFFKPDGSVLFVSGINNDEVFQYNLSTNWDLSTASFSNTSFNVQSQDPTPMDVHFSSDGDKMFIVGDTYNTVYQYSTEVTLTAGEKYYVQNDGTLSTTAGDPSVLAGTAISATKLVVKT